MMHHLEVLGKLSMKRKICVVTGTRADYGLLYWLLKKIEEDKNLQLQIIATGMHLSKEFGFTYKEIEKDFNIDKKIDMLLEDDSPVGISKSMGIALPLFTQAYKELQPDVIVVLGDRYEIFVASSAAMISRIPIAHIHGGETTQGAYDEAIRHSITKMSHIHFTASKEYKNRVIQLGENPNSVFNVGALGIENIKKLPLLSRQELEDSINFKLNKKNILATFHPVTLENNTSKKQFQEILNALDILEDTNIIFTKSNSDINGNIINQMIDKYIKSNPTKSICFTSLGQLRYLSALQYIDIMLGNSSSGLYEAPSFKIATINIGDRQKGRIKATSVIDSLPIKSHILEAINTSYTQKFKSILYNTQNPFENNDTSKQIKDIIKTISLDNILKKSFYDIK